MVESRFDTLAKLFASGMSRREALRQLSGTAAGLVLAALGVGCRGDALSPLADPGSRPSLSKETKPKKTCKDFCQAAVPHELGNTLRKRCEDVCGQCEGDLARLCGEVDNRICCPTGFSCCQNFFGDPICCPPGFVCTPSGGCLPGS